MSQTVKWYKSSRLDTITEQINDELKLNIGYQIVVPPVVFNEENCYTVMVVYNIDDDEVELKPIKL